MPRKTDSTNPADWLLVAGADLAMIRDALGDDAAFTPCRAKLAEALEKLMKAELIRGGWTLTKTHDLQFLATELARRDAALEEEIRPLCQALSEFYLHTRYPGISTIPIGPRCARSLKPSPPSPRKSARGYPLLRRERAPRAGSPDENCVRLHVAQASSPVGLAEHRLGGRCHFLASCGGSRWERQRHPECDSYRPHLGTHQSHRHPARRPQPRRKT